MLYSSHQFFDLFDAKMVYKQIIVMATDEFCFDDFWNRW